MHLRIAYRRWYPSVTPDHDEREPAHHLTSTAEKVNHAEQVGSIEDLGTLDAMPKRPNNLPTGRGRQFNPFDDKVLETFQTGRPRLAVAEDLESAKVLIRRAAAYHGLGVDVVQTVTPDGRDAVAYLARAKRSRKADTPAENAPADQAEGGEAFDEEDDQANTA